MVWDFKLLVLLLLHNNVGTVKLGRMVGLSHGVYKEDFDLISEEIQHGLLYICMIF
jgi:hypothetical protein